MDGPPNAVMPRRRKEVNNCVIDSCGVGDISVGEWPDSLLAGRARDGSLTATTPLFAVVVQLPLFFMAHSFGEVGDLATLYLGGVDRRGR